MVEMRQVMSVFKVFRLPKNRPKHTRDIEGRTGLKKTPSYEDRRVGIVAKFIVTVTLAMDSRVPQVFLS